VRIGTSANGRLQVNWPGWRFMFCMVARFAHGEAETGMFAAGNTLSDWRICSSQFMHFLTPRSAQALPAKAQRDWTSFGKASLVFVVSLDCSVWSQLFSESSGPDRVGQNIRARTLIAVLSLATLIDAWG